MTEISRRFEQLIKDYCKKNLRIIPIKTNRGIWIGDILITNQLHFKNVYKNDQLIYSQIFLNETAIKIANLLAVSSATNLCDELYSADQEYGKWLNDWQHFKNQKIKSQNQQDHDRIELLNLRMQESKLRAEKAKIRVTSLSINNK